MGNPQGPNKVESLLPEKGCLPPLLDQKGVTERFPRTSILDVSLIESGRAGPAPKYCIL